MSEQPHLPRLGLLLRELLWARRVAALGTADADGTPIVSMVPYAIVPDQGALVIHVSALAAHSANLAQRPAVSLMVMEPEPPAGEPVHALARVTLLAQADSPERDSAAWSECRAAYLARFPEAEPMTSFGDFRFVLLRVTGARQVAGFGAARSVQIDELRLALQPG